MAAPALDLYEIAYLFGGADRVVDTALTALVESGRVRIAETGELATVRLHRRHPVEAAVLDAIGPRPRRSVGTVRRLAARDERLTAIGARLVAEGLVREPRRRTFRRAGRPALTARGRAARRCMRAEPRPEPVGGPVGGTAAGGTGALSVATNGAPAAHDPRLRSLLAAPRIRRSSRRPYNDHYTAVGGGVYRADGGPHAGDHTGAGHGWGW